MRKKSKVWKRTLSVWLLAATVFGSVMTASPTGQAATTVYGGSWKVIRNKVFYVDAYGKKAKGLVKIGNRKFYFSDKGVQRTGWWKINNHYYFFHYKNKSGGYLVKNKTVNGITLKKTGRAVLDARWKKLKMRTMYACSEIVAKTTNSSMSVLQKMKKVYDYERNNYHIGGDQTFHYSPHQDVVYAYGMVKTGRGVCYGWGALYAYLANACGAKKCAFISSGGHGWAEVNGLVSDPDWEFADKSRSYFNFSYELSGNGRPNYKGNRASIRWI